MTIINSIISAIGNNNSIYPLLVRDCGIEVPTKVYKTYKQNKDDKEIAYLATRERIIDEYATSAVWLGCIPLIDRLSNKFIRKKGYDPAVNVRLLKEEEETQKLEEQIKKLRENSAPKEEIEKLLKQKEERSLQSLSSNIEKFKNIDGAQKAVEELEKVKANSKIFKRLQCGKFTVSMVIPIALMGFIIPKAVFAMTAKTRKKQEELRGNVPKFELTERNWAFSGRDVFERFTLKNPRKITFKGGLAATICNFSTVEKMAITDGGYALGRVLTARKNKNEDTNYIQRYSESIDIGFKMLGMLYLNFVAPKKLENLLAKISKKLFSLDVNLDPLILGDREFIKQINDGSLKLPKTNNIKDMLEFIDNPENIDTLFVKYAAKFRKIKLIDNKIRDPRTFVDEKELGTLRDNMLKFREETAKIKEKALQELKDIKKYKNDPDKLAKAVNKYAKKFATRAKSAKTFNILANVGISSYLLACVLPDAQYAFRKFVLGTKLEPGLTINQPK